MCENISNTAGIYSSIYNASKCLLQYTLVVFMMHFKTIQKYSLEALFTQLTDYMLCI